MPRPFKQRVISREPGVLYFKPQGVPMTLLEEVNLTKDELEAVRLADEQGLYQETAARAMNISRQTFGNIISSARQKIARALLNGKALRIGGGVVRVETARGREGYRGRRRGLKGHF